MADIEKVKRGLKAHTDECAWVCNENCHYYEPSEYGCCDKLTADAMSVIEELQAEIERLQPKKGKWIFTGQKNAYGGTVIQCPFCDDKYVVEHPGNEHYCRNCGAKLTD